jgi:hypothetical protein
MSALLSPKPGSDLVKLLETLRAERLTQQPRAHGCDGYWQVTWADHERRRQARYFLSTGRELSEVAANRMSAKDQARRAELEGWPKCDACGKPLPPDCTCGCKAWGFA